MKFEVYGRNECKLCKSAEKKLRVFLDKHGMGEGVEMCFIDMDTEEGAAEGDFFDVFHIPTVLLVRKADSAILGRWDGKPPLTEDLEKLLCNDSAQSAAA